MLSDKQRELIEFYKEMSPRWLRDRKGETVVIKSREEFTFFKEHSDAYDFANERYKLKDVIIKLLDDQPIYVSGITTA